MEGRAIELVTRIQTVSCLASALPLRGVERTPTSLTNELEGYPLSDHKVACDLVDDDDVVVCAVKEQQRQFRTPWKWMDERLTTTVDVIGRDR